MPSKIQHISPRLKLIDVNVPVPGFGGFIASYLVLGEKNAIIDSGPAVGIPNLLSALSRVPVKPEHIDYIIPTHVHLDHGGGVGTLLKKLPNAMVLAHPRALPHLIDPGRLWESSLKTLGDLAVRYGKPEAVPEERISAVADGMVLDFGERNKWEVCFTPGHAPHHLCLYNASSRVLMAGDMAGVFFHDALRAVTPPPFKLEEYLSSVDRLSALNPEKLCYAHFGCYDSAVERLDRVKKKVLLWYGIAQTAVEQGMNEEQTLSIMKKRDPEMNYLDDLNEADRYREFDLVMNSIRGLTALVRDKNVLT